MSELMLFSGLPVKWVPVPSADGAVCDRCVMEEYCEKVLSGEIAACQAAGLPCGRELERGYYEYVDDNNETKENETMESVFNFNGLFGKVGAGMCRLDMHGRTAVKTSNGYKTYDLKTKRLVNCAQFCFDLGDEMFFVIPTSEVEVGDIILVNRTPRCVVGVKDDSITVIDYENSEIKQIVPERHVFMGNTYFYGKIVSLMGGMLDGAEGGFENILKFKMMSSMLGNGKSGGMFGGGMDSLLPLMMLSGKGGDMFGNMFDGMFKKKNKKAKTEEAETESEEENA